MNAKLLIGIFLAGIILLSGCITKFDPTVEINENGSGKISIEAFSLSEIDDTIRDFTEGKKDLKIDKSKVDDKYYYKISFSFDNIREISENASFEVTDLFDRKKYEYTDLISAKTITGKDEEFIDFEYCVNLPGNVTKLVIDVINDTTYNGKKIACIPIQGDKDNSGQSIQLISEKMKEGCLYNNPACNVTDDCINNQCFLKQGCNYDNPKCQEGFECKENKCQEKINNSFVLLVQLFLLVITVTIAGVGYFMIKKKNEGSKKKEEKK